MITYEHLHFYEYMNQNEYVFLKTKKKRFLFKKLRTKFNKVKVSFRTLIFTSSSLIPNKIY